MSIKKNDVIIMTATDNVYRITSVDNGKLKGVLIQSRIYANIGIIHNNLDTINNINLGQITELEKVVYNITEEK